MVGLKKYFKGQIDSGQALIRRKIREWSGIAIRPIRDCNTAGFQKAVTRAGIGPLRWHDLRHTWASWHIQAGTTLKELKDLGGWESYAMVLKYAHLAPDHLAAAAENLARKSAQRSAGVPRGT